MNTSVMCVIVKNEQRYIREWVEYNLNIGFDKIYIYEDYGSKSHEKELKDYIKSNKIELVSLDSNSVPVKKGDILHNNQTQYHLFQWFLKECKLGKIKADWIGYFDVDEFITFSNEYSLAKLEKEFKDCDSVLLNWIIYGANGHIKRPEGNVVDNYTTHMSLDFTFDNGPMTKCLVNVKKETCIAIHNGGNSVYMNHKPVFDNTCFDKAYIRHYYTKSWEDYCERMERRGNMANNQRCYDLFFTCSPEFSNKEKEMIEERRYNSSNSDTMYISHKYNILRGGNVKRLNELKRKYLGI